jgi:hypothetical protein
MTISLAQPSAATTALLQDRLVGMAEGAAFGTRGLAASAVRRLHLSVPHPVFNLSLDALGRDDALQRVRMTGWRYLLTDGMRVIAAVEAAARWRNDRAMYSHTNEGAFVQSTARLLGECGEWPEMRSRDAVIGMLRVPSLYFVALWLRDARGRGRRDLFVPLDPAPDGLRTGQRLTGAQTVAALRRLARQRGRAVDDSN